MTQKPKKLLFDKNILPIAIVLVLLGGFFIYASEYSPRFFVVIAVINLLIVSFLWALRSQLLLFQTDMRLVKEQHLERINLLSVEIEKEKAVLVASEEKVKGYAQLKNIAERLSQCSLCVEAAEILTQETAALYSSGGTTVIFYLIDMTSGELAMMDARASGEKTNIQLKKGDLFDRWVVKNLKPLLVTDTSRDFRFDLEKARESEDLRDQRSLIIAPLMVGMKALGLLRVDSPKSDWFDTDDLRLLSTLADLGAVAVENTQLYERIQNLAIRDGLTGLYLRRFLLERMSQELPRQLRRKQQLSLLMIDLDYFKKYNDTFGHIAGDIVLKTLADIFLKIFKKPGNIVCRYGGEEFVVFMPDCSRDQAKQMAEELRKTVAETEIVLRREKTTITVSIGIACFPEDAQLKEELIQKADEAMYRAKEKGRNRVCLYS